MLTALICRFSRSSTGTNTKGRLVFKVVVVVLPKDYVIYRLNPTGCTWMRSVSCKLKDMTVHLFVVSGHNRLPLRRKGYTILSITWLMKYGGIHAVVCTRLTSFCSLCFSLLRSICRPRRWVFLPFVFTTKMFWPCGNPVHLSLCSLVTFHSWD